MSMTPELSRRIGRIINTKAMRGLSKVQWSLFINQCEDLETFDKLPKELQEFIVEAETELDENGRLKI